MTAPSRGFPVKEYATRLSRAQDMMARDGLDGVLLTTEADVRYFSGFQTLFWQSPTRPWFLFLPVDGKPVAVIPEIGAALMRRTWVEDIRTWPAPRPEDDGISLLRDLLSPLGNIGLPMGHETYLRMPLGDFDRLRRALPGIGFTDATGLIRSLRMLKSPAETEKIAHICRIGSATFALVPDFAAAGQGLDEVFRAFRRAALAEGADDVPYLVGGADQGGYHDVISPPAATPLRKGDVLMLDTGAVFDGYFCDFDRNWAIGAADDASRRAYDTLYRATEAGLSAARPGETCRAVLDAMAGVIGTGDGDVGRMGHGLGMQLTEWPSLAGFDDTVLEENMVMTLEPSLGYGDGRIMVHEENIVITSQSPRLLSARAAPDLPVIG